MRGDAGPWLLIILVLTLGVGFAWLTHHPEAEIVERGESWPLVGPLFTAFRERWSPQRDPIPEPPTAASTVEIVMVEPELPPLGDGVVWVIPGTQLHREPALSSPTLLQFDAIANVIRLERRGDWFRVWRRGTEGWVYLEGYAADGEPPYGRAVEPPRPVPGRAPEAAVLAAARQGLEAGGRELAAGPYRLYTDIGDERLLAELDRLAAGLETAYAERYGRTPIDAAREAVVLYAREASYRHLQRSSERLAGLHPGGHATAGMVALFAGGLPPSQVASTLVHELTHLLNRRALGPALPSWLDEGLADDLARTQTGSDGTIEPGIAGMPPIRGVLELEWEEFVRPPRGSLHYAAASAWVQFLLDGEEGRLGADFRAFLDAVSEGDPATPERLREELGLPWRKLDARFQAWASFRAMRDDRLE